jgi:predicted SnoaL-like aldol condensation-catalyzing enzyme
MSPIRMERVESGVRLMIAFTEAFNRHDVNAMQELLSDNAVFENAAPAPDGTVFQGKNAIAQFYQEFFTHSPDATIKIEDTFGYGLRCIMLWRCTWTDAAGNKHHLRGLDIYRVQDGAIHEKLSYVKG